MSEKNSFNTEKFRELITKWRKFQQPGIKHELFKDMLGSWDVRLVFHSGTEKWESECRAENRMLHGGRFLMEQIEGEIYAPNDEGIMEPESYSSTRIVGYDNFKKAYVGTFVENQNSYMLNYTGRIPLRGDSSQIVFYGLSDEPMLELSDATMKYVLSAINKDYYRWDVYALALGEEALVFEILFTRF